MTEINRPAVVAELSELYRQYEQALVTNNVATLTHLFWDSPHVIRFGVDENLYGRDEVAAFRNSRPTVNLARQILNMTVVTFGEDTGSVTIEFQRVVNGQTRQGRQSQFWKKLPEGWRIVSAHVSYLPLN